MRKIIKGKRYDTDHLKAEYISGDCWKNEDLYRMRASGQLFLVRQTIVPLSRDEADEWLKRHCERMSASYNKPAKILAKWRQKREAAKLEKEPA